MHLKCIAYIDLYITPVHEYFGRLAFFPTVKMYKCVRTDC